MKNFSAFSKTKGKADDALVTKAPEEKKDKKGKKKQDDLMDDLEPIAKAINKIQKVKDGDFTLISIMDVSLTDPTADTTNEAATIINADFGEKEVKRNDLLYITAMIRKKNFTGNMLAVFKVRVVDIFQNISILNTL